MAGEDQSSGPSAAQSQAVLQLVSAWAANKTARADIKNQNMLAKVNAQAQNQVREAQNALQAAESNYARWAQSVQNQRRLRVSGKQAEAAQQSLARLQDQRTSGDLARGVRAAEEQGMLAARNAFSGVAGGVSDVVAGTIALRAAIEQQQATQTGEQQAFEIRERAGEVASDAIQGLDNTAILSNLNFNQAIPKITPLIGNAITDTLLNNMDAVITLFKPKEKGKGDQPMVPPLPTAQSFPVPSGQVQGTPLEPNEPIQGATTFPVEDRLLGIQQSMYRI